MSRPKPAKTQMTLNRVERMLFAAQDGDEADENEGYGPIKSPFKLEIEVQTVVIEEGEDASEDEDQG